MNKLTKKQKEIEEEIKWYKPKKSIADGMMALGELGFEFSGHGCGFGGEDFSLSHGEEFYVNFCDRGRKVEATVNTNDDSDIETLFSGTVKGAIKFIQKNSKR